MYSIMPYTSNIAKRTFNGFMNDDFFRPFFSNEMTRAFRVDIKDEGDRYLLIADMPGAAKENIEVSVENGMLTIGAKLDENTEEKNDNYIRRERRIGNFSRSFSLDGIDENGISADYTDGVLTVNLTKQADEANAKRIIAIN